MALQEPARHAAEIDAQILDSRPVRHGEVGGHSNQQFMQRQPLRPKYDELAQLKTGEAVQLIAAAREVETFSGRKIVHSGRNSRGTCERTPGFQGPSGFCGSAAASS